MTNHIIQSVVYTKPHEIDVEGDLGTPDPAAEVAKAALGMDQKPWDCTCAYPQVRVRNMCGHPRECRYYARWERLCREKRLGQEPE